jgi:hypothetical protein
MFDFLINYFTSVDWGLQFTLYVAFHQAGGTLIDNFGVKQSQIAWLSRKANS